MGKFSTDVAFWAFNLVNQYQDLNFRLINADVRDKSRKIEEEAMQLTAAWEQEADLAAASSGNASTFTALTLLTERSNAFAEEKVAEWWNFAWSLVVKYRGYVITHNETMTGVDPFGQAYPSWWLRSTEVGYSTWQPNGPYHGLIIEAPEAPFPQSAVAQSFGRWSDANTTCFAIVLGCLVAAVSYRVGVQRGQRSLERDAYLLMSP
jgi:hypothetical protein